jgi:hypothetical protein
MMTQNNTKDKIKDKENYHSNIKLLLKILILKNTYKIGHYRHIYMFSFREYYHLYQMVNSTEFSFLDVIILPKYSIPFYFVMLL